MNKKNIKVAVGMSGGVDSAVTAKLLVDQGYTVIGFMMKFWSDPTCKIERDNACCDPKAIEDAKRVAAILKIPFYVIDAREKFKKYVVDYFIEEYKNNRTPNPCVVCNEKIKFGWFLDFAKSLGCDFVATGHYARIVNNSATQQLSPASLLPLCGMQEQGRLLRQRRMRRNSATNLLSPKSKLPTYRLFRGIDETKDQSYFLYRLDQKQLSQIILPLGGYTKDRVRAMAKKWKLPVYEKKESQEVCFIQNNNYREFLRHHLPAKNFISGKIVDTKGDIIGNHSGLIDYTIGQRKGVNQTESLIDKLKVESLKLKGTNKKPLYVIGFNHQKNELIVGEPEDLLQKEMIVQNLNWINQDFSGKMYVKIRYRAEAVECLIRHPEFISGSNKIPKQVRNDKLIVIFKELQRAITPGQSAVFYNGDEVVGGGIIS